MFNQKLQKLGTEHSAIRELFEYGLARKKEIGEENVFDFSLGNPNVPAPACVTEELLRLIGEMPPEKLHAYSSAVGLKEVRAAIAQYIQSSFGVPMSEDLIFMTCGASASLVSVLSALLLPEEEVIVPAPYFPEYALFIEQAGGKMVPVPTDEKFHLDLHAIERAITERTKAILINSPNNPTGAVYTKGELEGLAALLERVNTTRKEPIFLLSDEPYRELCYGEKPTFPMVVYPHTVVLYSFSKVISLPGERIGYVAVSPACYHAQELFFAVRGAARYHGYVCAPTLFQRVVADCQGVTSDLEVYRRNRDLLYGALSDMGYSCTVPEGAFFLFVKALEPDAKAFCARAKKHELLLVPSDSFGTKGYVRISYCVKGETVERSLPAFRALFEEYNG